MQHLEARIPRTRAAPRSATAIAAHRLDLGIENALGDGPVGLRPVSTHDVKIESKIFVLGNTSPKGILAAFVIHRAHFCRAGCLRAPSKALRKFMLLNRGRAHFCLCNCLRALSKTLS
eukprot:4833880-Pleurochrysis_carterae.AAC.4